MLLQRSRLPLEEAQRILATETLDVVAGELGADRLASRRDLLFGRIAISRALATSREIQEALLVQYRPKELGLHLRLGEILKDRGVLDEAKVRRVLDIQRSGLGRIPWSALARTTSVSPDDLLLGASLVGHGLLSKGEVDECRFVQRLMRHMGLARTLANVVVEKGLLDAPLLERVASGIVDVDSAAGGAGPSLDATRMLEGVFEAVLASRAGEEASA